MDGLGRALGARRRARGLRVGRRSASSRAGAIRSPPFGAVGRGARREPPTAPPRRPAPFGRKEGLGGRFAAVDTAQGPAQRAPAADAARPSPAAHRCPQTSRPGRAPDRDRSRRATLRVPSVPSAPKARRTSTSAPPRSMAPPAARAGLTPEPNGVSTRNFPGAGEPEAEGEARRGWDRFHPPRGSARRLVWKNGTLNPGPFSGFWDCGLQRRLSRTFECGTVPVSHVKGPKGFVQCFERSPP